MVEDVREVKIMWEGKEVIVKLKKLTFGEQYNIVAKSMKVKNVNNIPIMDMDVVKMKWEMLKKSIVDAPFEVNDENIGKLSAEDGWKLLEVSDELNKFPEENLSP